MPTVERNSAFNEVFSTGSAEVFGSKPVEAIRSYRYALAALLLFYVVLATALSLTKAPICDEGWYGNPAINLVKNGQMGSPVIEGAGGFLKGIDQYTYWIMPVHILAQTGWYEAFGASLFTMRMLSVVSGLIVLICWYVIVVRLSESRTLALLVVLFAELDTTFMALAATGRSDMLSLAFGSAGLTCYLLIRGRNFSAALLISHGLVVASGLTHPIGGMTSFASLVFFHCYMDRRRFGLNELAVVAVPYAVGAMSWGMYISKSPNIFWSQFSGNTGERLRPLKAPLRAIQREVLERLIGGYRMGSSSWTPLANLRLLVLMAYIASAVFVAIRRTLRRTRVGAVVLAQIALTFAILTFFEGSKQSWYLLHLVWPFAAALALSANWVWNEWKRYRQILTIVLATVLCIEAGYPLLLIYKNNYRTSYLASIAVLKSHVHGSRSVMGSAELGFGLGFDNVTDDHYLGYYTGTQPDFIVVDGNYRGFLQAYRQREPEIYRYIQSLLAERYRQIHNGERYTIWVKLAKR